MVENKVAFLSYAHEDREFAEKTAIELRKAGIDVWMDKWEINVGDSIIQKIFREGLSNCDVFLIIVSCASVDSTWVKEEIDAAFIKKIEGITRIIPIIKEKCEIPLNLRPLSWADLSEDFDSGIRQIIKSIYGVSDKPPLGKIPEYIVTLKNSVGGLSKIASTIGSVFISHAEEKMRFDEYITSEELHKFAPMLTIEEFNDAVDELEEYGLVKTIKYFGTAPYDFGSIKPTYALFLHFKDEGLDYDPIEDIKSVAATIASKNQLNGKTLQEYTKIQPLRLNRAVAYLDDYGIIETINYLGTAPFDFGTVIATRKTRQYVNEHCK